MIEITKRKLHTKYILEKTTEFLSKVTGNNATSGFLIFLIHWLLGLFCFVYILVGKLDLVFYISVVLWIGTLFMHFYFGGCICTRLERHLWKTNRWWGPWMMVFTPIKVFSGGEITGNLANNIFICWGALLTAFIFFKILLNT